MAYSIVSRATWGAKPPKQALQRMAVPALYVFAHHSVTEASNGTAADERRVMRELQAIAFGRGFRDISYSFAIFRSGRIYEGRGWAKVGAHTVAGDGTDYNAKSHGFVFVGNYENQTPTRAQLDAFRWLVKEGRRRGYVSSAPRIRGHRDVKATACPGRNVYAKMDYLRTAYSTASYVWVVADGSGNVLYKDSTRARGLEHVAEVLTAKGAARIRKVRTS
jgi:hypothetical protein